MSRQAKAARTKAHAVGFCGMNDMRPEDREAVEAGSTEVADMCKLRGRLMYWLFVHTVPFSPLSVDVFGPPAACTEKLRIVP